MTSHDLEIEYQRKFKIQDGIYIFHFEREESAYGIYLDSFPQEIRENIRNDFKAAEVLINSLDRYNVPKIDLKKADNEEVCLIEDKGVGKTDETSSFYEAASLHLLTSKTDIKGNIVEGAEGYAPIDYEAFLRSPLTEKASYLKNGRKYRTDTELYVHSLTEIEEEANRHNIEYESARLKQTAVTAAEYLRDANIELRQERLSDRANNLEENINLILEGQINLLN